MITWQWSRLEEMTSTQSYRLFAARSTVFVIEQNCVYQDLDGLDLEALHLIGWSGNEVAACLRVLAPGAKYVEASLGRVLTTAAFRGTGVGRDMLALGLQRIDRDYPSQPTRIGAQAHLQKFYGEFGFHAISDIFIEDGIPHVEMLRLGS